MKRIEPNLLLAVSVALPLILLVLTAATFGEAGRLTKYVIIVLTCPILFVLMNGLMRRGQPPRPPMIQPTAPATVAWAGLLPFAVMIMAGVPFFFPGHDYGLMVIVASVFFGLALESAWKARPR